MTGWRYRLSAWMVATLAILLPSPALAACQVAQMLELKVTMSDMQPLVSAKINGADVRFVADSGAFYSVISPGSAAELNLKLKPIPASFQIRGVGGSASASLTTVKDLTLAGITLNNIEFFVSGSEVGAIGLLGQNVLGLRDVEYDLEHGAIRIMKSTDCTKANLAYWAANRPVSTLDVTRHSFDQPHTIGTVYLNGKPMRAMFDTGAGRSILSLDAAARAGIRPNTPGVRPNGASSGVGRHIVQTWIAPVTSLKIGDEEVRNIHIEIGQIGLDDADMLIGADFFLSHRVYVANGIHTMFFTYDGGPVFNTTPQRVVSADGTVQTLPADATTPTDAEGFSRRGAAFLARRQYDLAIADFTRACQLAPTEARYFYQRATARLEAKRTFPALADLDRTITLDPGNVDAHLTRAALRIEVPDKAEAHEDIDAAEKLVAKPSDQRLQIGALYEQVDAFDQAIAQYDLWIQAHPDDSKRAMALNDRCWARAQAGRDLDKALADCDGALRLTPRTASILDSRGLVHLRMGDADKAIADYDAALALAPKMAWSLYGRGVAEQRKGLKQQADADIAAAAAINPKLLDRAKSLGVAP